MHSFRVQGPTCLRRKLPQATGMPVRLSDSEHLRGVRQNPIARGQAIFRVHFPRQAQG